MEQIELNATVRKTTGNSPARELRRGGQIPAVLYGPQTEPILLSVNIKELEQIFKRGNIGSIILNLVIQNGKKITKPAMIKELQSHPVSGNFIHIDFYEIDMQRRIRVGVPVVTRGKAAGVEEGGMLQIVRREVEVLCLPTAIPDVIELDVTHLNIGDSIHVHEIPFASDVEIPADVDYTVVTVLAPKVEKLEEEEALAEGEEAALEEGAEGEAAGEKTPAEEAKED